MGRLASTILALALAAPATAAVIGTSGDVALLAGPLGSTLEGANESNLQIRLFEERLSVPLAVLLAVDIDLPGSYSGANPPVAGSGSVPALALVDSFFVHFDIASGNQTRSGSVSFDEDVLGVIAIGSTLGASDGALGAPGTAYIGSDAARGPEFGPDSVTLSADRRTVSFTLQVNGPRVDQLRIVTAAEPTTGALLAGGLAALALLARRRRSRPSAFAD